MITGAKFSSMFETLTKHGEAIKGNIFAIDKKFTVRFDSLEQRLEQRSYGIVALLLGCHPTKSRSQ